MAPTDNIYALIMDTFTSKQHGAVNNNIFNNLNDSEGNIQEEEDLLTEEEEELSNAEDFQEMEVAEETPKSSITVDNVEMNKPDVCRRLFQSDSEDD